MAHILRDLNALSDSDLIRLHDAAADNVTVGVDYYLNEIHRRQAAAAIRTSQRLAAAATGLAAVGATAGVVSLFLR
ncbi:hypothetical protein [Aeromicrobium stalagmiti]|uniref:hypothetical protein n=1 Tax=Aeromicrobium stalagmiti TaxID=2738988 RepID=UPI00156A1ECF|nr:hypothetical protein [Aeromicrobium stalagmiti]NRQ51563.1 hypothetical protein [Aeromicrobium stalagmiti]